MKLKNESTKTSMPRRTFLSATAKGAIGLTVLPSNVISGLGHIAPSDKLNVAGIGIGGKGRNNLKNVVGQNIVALCDIDWDFAAPQFKNFPKAKKWTDYRKMLDNQKDIDACIIATPDHTHAIPAMIAMQLGKHVYVQKPLTQTIWESRQLSLAAKKYKVATQMGTEGHSSDSVWKLAEYLWSGAIGEIVEVHLWADRPAGWWPQGVERPKEQPPVPRDLDWDLFIGPAPWRPYHQAYTPFRWRGWWDFGTGALGDMGCHVFDAAVYALKLIAPVSIHASSTPVYTETAPQASRIEYIFPARADLPNLKLPEVKVVWYDGGLLPPRPAELPDGERLGSNLYIGTKGKLMCDTYGSNIKLLPLDKNTVEPDESLERIPDHPLGGGRHEMDWVRACKEDPENRKEAASNFDVACPLTEIVLMGNLAIRLQDLNRRLLWNEEEMKITNIQPEETIRMLESREFGKIPEGGKPSVFSNWKEMNAMEGAEQWIKPTYREGWGW